ncbi:macrophage mannose receptor 1-like protein, partial [Aphelenchoides avenae]
FISLLIPAALALCPFQNAFPHDNYCYFLLDRSDIAQNQGGNAWQLSEDHCIRFGGHLASVSTEELNELLRGQVQYKANQPFWLGLHAQKGGEDGKFKLEWSDNTTVSYTNWARGKSQQN